MPNLRRLLGASLVVAAPAILAVCSGSAVSDPSISRAPALMRTPAPGFIKLQGAGDVDTNQAAVPRPLTIVVHAPGGGLASHVQVEVRGFQLSFQSDTQPAAPVGATVTDTTDAHGRLRLNVAFGTVARPTSVVVAVPALGLTDSATYTILAGNAVAPRIFTTDRVQHSPPVVKFLALLTNNARNFEAGLVDRFGNVAAGAPTLSIAGALATLTNDTPFAARAAPPAWSPDGSTIAFTDMTNPSNVKMFTVEGVTAFRFFPHSWGIAPLRIHPMRTLGIPMPFSTIRRRVGSIVIDLLILQASMFMLRWEASGLRFHGNQGLPLDILPALRELPARRRAG